MDRVLFLALTAALNPTLVAATTVMLLLGKPERLMIGYLLGAMMTSITAGLVIVFYLSDSSLASSGQSTIGPAADVALGILALVGAFAIHKARQPSAVERRQIKKEHKQEKKKDKRPPAWQRVMSKGSPWATFAVGAALTLPGASYLAGLTAITKLNYSTAGSVLTVLLFNVIMLALLEIPLIGYRVRPEQMPGAVEGFKSWLQSHGGRYGMIGLATIGGLLIIKGIIGLLV